MEIRIDIFDFFTPYQVGASKFRIRNLPSKKMSWSAQTFGK